MKIKPQSRLLLAAASLVLLAALDVRLKVQKYTLDHDSIHAPVRIALVTDLHSCRYGNGTPVLAEFCYMRYCKYDSRAFYPYPYQKNTALHAELQREVFQKGRRLRYPEG